MPGLSTKISVKSRSRAIKKSEKADCRSNVISSPGKIKVKVPATAAAVSATGVSTWASSAYEVPSAVKVNYGALEISSGSSSGNGTKQ